LASPDGMEVVKGNAPIEKLVSDGMEVLKIPLTGYACPTTSSA
jgi:hypothetical protein